MLEQYVALEPHEYVAVALWIIHTHVYERFMVTPRLLLNSPVRSCGKTTLLDVAGRLVARPEKSDSITPAAIYHIIHETRRTLLLDEADNLDLSAKAILRAVLNAGHRQGGTVTRMYRGGAKRLSVFAPIALASIGSLTLPLMSRSIVIRMRRHDGAQFLRRFDLADTSDLDLVYGHVRHWVNGAILALDPDMPAELRGRHADNWRPLLSIADACGPAWSALVRDAAIAFSRGNREEDIAVTLLFHVRDIFDALGVDRLASKRLVDELISLDGADAAWAEYRGASGTERPRKLTQGGLATLLRPFEIRPRTIWPLARTATTKSFRGYFRVDFEAAWRSYCGKGVTPSQPREIRRLRSL
jgi:putative DNA primase/helicase